MKHKHLLRFMAVMTLFTDVCTGQTVLGKHPADVVTPAFLQQNGNANTFLTGLGAYGTVPLNLAGGITLGGVTMTSWPSGGGGGLTLGDTAAANAVLNGLSTYGTAPLSLAGGLTLTGTETTMLRVVSAAGENDLVASVMDGSVYFTAEYNGRYIQENSINPGSLDSLVLQAVAAGTLNEDSEILTLPLGLTLNGPDALTVINTNLPDQGVSLTFQFLGSDGAVHNDAITYDHNGLGTLGSFNADAFYGSGIGLTAGSVPLTALATMPLTASSVLNGANLTAGSVPLTALGTGSLTLSGFDGLTLINTNVPDQGATLVFQFLGSDGAVHNDAITYDHNGLGTLGSFSASSFFGTFYGSGSGLSAGSVPLTALATMPLTAASALNGANVTAGSLPMTALNLAAGSVPLTALATAPLTAASALNGANVTAGSLPLTALATAPLTAASTLNGANLTAASVPLAKLDSATQAKIASGGNPSSSFRIMVIPDNQNMGQAGFEGVMNWANTTTIQPPIKAIIGLGDFIDEDTWAMKANGINIVSSIPVLWCIGNHDYDGESPAGRPSTLWNTYIPRSFYTSKSWFSGGFYDTVNSYNVYQTITNGTLKLLLMTVEFGPRTSVLNWVSNVAALYPDHTLLVATHNYLTERGTESTGADPYDPQNNYGLTDANNGQQTWSNLVGVANLGFVLSGHRIWDPWWEYGLGFPVGSARNISVGTYGNWVNEAFHNFQNDHTSKIMLYTFNGTGPVLVETYDPVVNVHYNDPTNQWVLPFPTALPANLAAVPPKIWFQPTNVVNVLTNGTVWSGFYVYAGPGVLNYQWCFNGTPVAGQTSANWQFIPLANSAGSYSCIVSNPVGCITSTVATLTGSLPTVPDWETNVPGFTPYAYWLAPDYTTNGSLAVWPSRGANPASVFAMPTAGASGSGGGTITPPYLVTNASDTYPMLSFGYYLPINTAASRALTNASFANNTTGGANPWEIFIVLRYTNTCASAAPQIILEGTDVNNRTGFYVQDTLNTLMTVTTAGLQPAFVNTSWEGVTVVMDMRIGWGGFVNNYGLGILGQSPAYWFNNATSEWWASLVSTGLTLGSKSDMNSARGATMGIAEVLLFKGSAPGSDVTASNYIWTHFQSKYTIPTLP